MILWHAKLSLKKFYSTLQHKSVHRLLDTLGWKKKDFFFHRRDSGGIHKPCGPVGGMVGVRAHRTSLLHSQINCAASVGQCKTLSDLKSRCYICKEHPHWAEKMVDFEIWISRPWLWLVDSNFWFEVFEGLQE